MHKSTRITNSESFSADKPINTVQEDRFQRFNFSKRIADTITHRKSSDSIVLGLFGEWGSGKSSILNLINNELSKESDSILLLEFNPWMYNHEENLLLSFFKKIADVLGKNPITKTETFGAYLEAFGGVFKSIGFDNAKIGMALKSIDLEEFKNRINGFLTMSSKKLVIIIDDIDRLDKQELSTLFKLIKLNADFTNTTYILSFDEVMVSSAIGTKFGEGDRITIPYCESRCI